MRDAATNLFQMDCRIAYTSRLGGDEGLPFPGAEDIQFGYNIYKASPLSREDHGYAGRIYDFDWGQVKKHSSGKYYPTAVDIRENDGCQSTMKTIFWNSEIDMLKS